MASLEKQIDWIKTSNLLPIPKPLLYNAFLYKSVKFTQSAAWEIYLSYFGEEGNFGEYNEYMPAAR